MANYYLTNKAVKDLEEIWEYTIEEWSEEQADKYYEMIIDSCELVGKNPELGKNYPGIRTELFGLKSNRHIIFYRIVANSPIEITRILHGRMDLRKRIKE